MTGFTFSGMLKTTVVLVCCAPLWAHGKDRSGAFCQSEDLAGKPVGLTNAAEFVLDKDYCNVTDKKAYHVIYSVPGSAASERIADDVSCLACTFTGKEKSPDQISCVSMKENYNVSVTLTRTASSTYALAVQSDDKGAVATEFAANDCKTGTNPKTRVLTPLSLPTFWGGYSWEDDEYEFETELYEELLMDLSPAAYLKKVKKANKGKPKRQSIKGGYLYTLKKHYYYTTDKKGNLKSLFIQGEADGKLPKMNDDVYKHTDDFLCFFDGHFKGKCNRADDS